MKEWNDFSLALSLPHPFTPSYAGINFRQTGDGFRFCPVAVNFPVCWSMRKDTTLSVFWLATRRNAPAGSTAKLRGHLPRVASCANEVQLARALINRERDDAVMAAVRPVNEPARRVDVDVGAKVRPAEIRRQCRNGSATPSTLPWLYHRRTVNVESSSLMT